MYSRGDSVIGGLGGLSAPKRSLYLHGMRSWESSYCRLFGAIREDNGTRYTAAILDRALSASYLASALEADGALVIGRLGPLARGNLGGRTSKHTFANDASLPLKRTLKRRPVVPSQGRILWRGDFVPSC